MASTFHGKWTFYVPNNKRYVGYGGPNPWLFMLPGPPRKETIIVFVLRTDKELCFFMQNGKYVECERTGILPLADERERAGVFDFPGHDYKNLPTSFTSKIHGSGDVFLLDVESNLFAEVGEHIARVFTITQHTPTLEEIQTSKKGDGLDLAGVDLSGGTLDNVSLVGTDFSHSNLTNFKFTNCTMKKALLNNCTMKQTDFSGSNLSGANLNKVDLTGVVIGSTLPHFYTTPLQPPSPDNPRATFFESQLNQSLLANDWSMLDLRGTTILNFSSPLSSREKPLQVKYSILTGLNKNNLSDLSLEYAVFDHAVLDNVNLNGADLTNASFIQANMHGTVLSNATLKNANLTGAQLGTLSNLFTLPAGYETHLNAGPPVDAALRDQFAQHGITLSTTASLNTQAPGRVWQLNDAGNNITYTVRLEGAPSQVLTVYKPATAASLVNAYMPDAILTGANLFGITANNIQFYGSKARIDGSAILEGAKLNSSNLSTVNFTQAQLMGANLSNCHLFNAKFNKANLSSSAAGGAADLSDSNLQGADFTDAQLYGANMTNAAVAIKVPTKANPKQGGVYLFSLPYKGDTNFLQQYITELNDAATKFSLNPKGDDATLQQFLTALKNNNLAPLKIAFAKRQPPIKLSNNAQIKVVEVNAVWQIVDDSKSYTLWIDPDELGNDELYAAPSLNITQAAFKNRNMTLRWQASASLDTPTDTTVQQWLLDNDSENPKNFSTGYVRFIMKLNGNVLDVYGTALRILRLGDQSHEEFDTETCQVTLLSQTNMNADTICPNGATLGVNQSRSGESWNEKWLRAATLPSPPACVPTDYNWCPPPKVKKKE